MHQDQSLAADRSGGRGAHFQMRASNYTDSGGGAARAVTGTNEAVKVEAGVGSSFIAGS